ncbi:PAS domain S-box protein [Bacillus solimangrovi]|uniref:PAS domain S-box protein n=2 Tax=Bacillus solimangrovi TaxID=1305675 RepID=A0A1E5LE75_9BACI|nr:PAS domain S-box protein [Bacillus solimangrovi]
MFAFIFTAIYALIGSSGILLLNTYINTIANDIQHYNTLVHYKSWVFLLFTSCIMFYIAYRFIFRDRVYIKNLLDTREKLDLYGEVFKHMHEGLIITDKNAKIIEVNPSFVETTGYTKHEVLGKNPNILNSNMHSNEFYKTMWNEIDKQKTWSGELINQRKNGEVYPERLSITSIKDINGKTKNFIGVFTDISKQRQAEGKIEFLTHYDSFTRLPKLQLFMKHLTYCATSTEYDKTGFSLFIIDIGKLKQLNAAFGYKVGDELIQRAATRIHHLYRSHTLARVNSKEFALILPSVTEREEITFEVDKILKGLDAGFVINGEHLFISANIGISTFKHDSTDPEELYKYALLAKTASKENKRAFQCFGDQLQSDIKRKLTLESHLHKALENNELLLYYQPQIDLKSEQICGLEVLMRWKHQELGIVSPVDFIPLAEETGLIIPFGEWVLETVCNNQIKWAKQGYEPIKTAINLSPKQFQDPNLVKTTKRILEETGVNRSLIEFEITESLSMFENKSVINTVKDLRKLGIEVSIDDFGTGHSNLSYLQKLSIDILKVDRAFIWDIPNNKSNIALTKAIIAMAHELNLKVVAEGVETEEQLRFLQELECEFAQGFFFSKPLPEKETLALLQSTNEINHLSH